MTEERTTEQRNRLEINYVQVVASALAAISSAVLLSTVGVAGTIIGAAIGSVFATAGSALYSYSIRLSRERVARAQAAAFARMQAARAGMFTRPMDRPGAEPADLPDEVAPPEENEPPAWREALRRLPWKWIALIAVGVFVVAMIVILCFELIVGRSVSQITGGTSDTGHRTSVPGLGGAAPAHTPTPTSTKTPKPTTSPSQQPTTALPSAGVTPSPTPTPTAGTTEAPSASATPTPTPTPSPSATLSSTPTSSATSSTTPSP